jgi:hypothetical protein
MRGTDVVTGFIGGCPLLPIVAAELSGLLGAAVEAWSDFGVRCAKHRLLLELDEVCNSCPLPALRGSNFAGDVGFIVRPGVCEPRWARSMR